MIRQFKDHVYAALVREFEAERLTGELEVSRGALESMAPSVIIVSSETSMQEGLKESGDPDLFQVELKQAIDIQVQGVDIASVETKAFNYLDRTLFRLLKHPTDSLHEAHSGFEWVDSVTVDFLDVNCGINSSDSIADIMLEILWKGRYEIGNY